MSSPITSVPDPSENSALASMITQVQPGQTPVVVRGARPKKPPAASAAASSSSDPAKKKKKKQTRSAAETTETAEATQLKSQDEAVAEAARLGSQAALSQSRAVSGSNPAQDQDAGQHSHQASSTVMASTADNSVTNTEPTALTTATDRQATEGENGTAPVSSRVVPTTADAPTQPAATKAAVASVPSSSTASASKTPTSAQPKATASKPASPSFGKRLVAFLTCSSASSAMVRSEMQEKQRANAPRQASSAATASGKAAAAASAPGLVVPPRTPNAKGGSQQGGDYPTTPGGGTQLPREETGDVMSGAVVPPGSAFVTTQDAQKSRQSTSSFSEEETDEDEEDDDELDPEDDYLTDDQTEEHRLIMQGGIGIPLDEFGNPHPLLPAIGEPDKGRKCLVLDLDETLVHSSFKMIQNADFIVPVEIDGTVHNVYVIKRPGVDEFMRLMGEIYEVVVFTASLSKYADPVLDMLDIHHSVRHRLFRESCYNHKGNYVKDLSQLGREIADSIIIDNSPASYIFHPNNAVPISSWFNDPHDTELTDLCPFLADLAHVDDVRAVLDGAL